MNYLQKVIHGRIGLFRLFIIDYFFLGTFITRHALLWAGPSSAFSIFVAIVLNILRLTWLYGMWQRARSHHWMQACIIRIALLPFCALESFSFFASLDYLVSTPLQTDISSTSLDAHTI